MEKSMPTGFAYHKTAFRYVSLSQNGAWMPGSLTTDETVTLNESACVLQYAQTCFEGLKAFRTESGHIICFRPDLNAARLHDSCIRMRIPPLPDGMFEDALRQVVLANRDDVPDAKSGGSLYLRPVIFGTNPVLGVKPATEFQFRLFASPVGSYFAGGARPLRIRITDFDRAAPHGTGHIKAGLNYAMSLYAIADAHEKGYDENLYLDAATRTYVEETGGANIIFITKDGEMVTPKSDSILPSITRRSLLYVGEHYLGMKTIERPVRADELGDFVECGLCGTAAVISPVGTIEKLGSGEVYSFRTGEPDSRIDALRKTLLAIQHNEIPAPDGWIMKIE
jgi:branched-chain amino acid aminotransferase